MAKKPIPSEPTLEWFKDFEVRIGGDGKAGIYLRSYNVRVAVFNSNSSAIQTRLKLLFERANKPVAVKTPRKRKPKINEAWGPGSGNW